MLTALQRAAALAALLATCAATGTLAQATADHEEHHSEPGVAAPGAGATGTMPPTAPGNMGDQDHDAQSGQRGMMSPGMMDDMMGSGMMGDMMGPGMMGGMARPGAGEAMAGMGMRHRRHMMKVMFAIADADGDGGLSLEEIADIHRRVFGAVDADKDGRVTPEELQTFMQE
ncbi:EF-hand domain-containing protein [Paracoccus benzoatiresistens]|uniref:EF-hand domain-containing protein n=1 Tax=Paracoccus benzoatiresistens TaxID=2997341 RepID=A0ABT4JD36_9RHOB|nr:EF-hand domain-containing protein [Paracoccus sp. EF6]MCZ0964497.1 EF-hand domain-containing protein [Paracoccus sp. EF6]